LAQAVVLKMTSKCPLDEMSSRREAFDRDGFLHVKGFCTAEECTALKQRMAELIDAWEPKEEELSVFETNSAEQQKVWNSYFLDSADQIHFFLEKDAKGATGLKDGISKHKALNKVGHGLHVRDSMFREYSRSDKVAELVNELGWTDPVLPQSMYIFKQPRIGGEVTAHQDSTFLYTTPKPTCLGLWLALDAATLDNGCIWARPGSHTEPVRRHFVRNPARFEDGNDTAEPMVFKDLADKTWDAWSWEGQLPADSAPPSKGLYEAGFKPVECAAGDLIVIHGQVDHLSLPNTSEKDRHTFQLHLVEGPTQGIAWSPLNWLQYPQGAPFPGLGKGTKRKAADQ